jgi:hypothetical protein
MDRAGLDLSELPRYEIEIRGRREMLAIRTLARAADLSTADADPIGRSEAAADNPAIAASSG